MVFHRIRNLRWQHLRSDYGISMIETVAALVFVTVLITAIAATNPGNYFHDYIRKAVCLVGGPNCEGESWIEVEDTNPPQRRPVTFGAGIPAGSVKNEANRELGKGLAAERGWDGAEWECLDNLWQRESGWDHTAINPSSKAAGIPQLLPKAGHDIPQGFYDDPTVQIKWGLNYIAERYQTPCAAWAHWQNPPDGDKLGHWY
ncbi:transglycosylase SLT domain-containing protein [Nocardiopsis rhodophaea]